MPISILIADDHAMFRSGLKALLEKEISVEARKEAEKVLATPSSNE